jgi:hypothetical protein
MAEKQWCPGCSREVEGVCHHFNCAIGPNGLDAQSRSSAATTAPLLPCPFCGNKPAIEDRDLAGKAKTIFCAEHDCIGPSTTAASYDDAAVQWNRRTGAAQQPIDLDLVQRCKELLGWSKTGLLNGGSGGAVRALADRLRPKIGDHYALNVAENQTRDDAMREIVRLATHPPAAPVELDALVEKITPQNRHEEVGLECSSAGTGVAPSSPAESKPVDRGNYEDRHPKDEVLWSASDLQDHIDVVAELGLEESHVTPAEAVRELKAELEQARSQVEQEIQNWKARNRAACAAEAEVKRLTALVEGLTAQPQEARSREDIAKIIGGDIFHGSDDGVGPATRHARVEALKKADAILALSRPKLDAGAGPHPSQQGKTGHV